MTKFLIIEDNKAEIELIKFCLSSLEIAVEPIFITNGDDAHTYIQKNYKKIDIILLDLNIPSGNGHDILKWFKGQEETKHIPILVFTNSENPSDIKRAYTNGTNCYILKPVGIYNFKKTLSGIIDFWTQISIIPQN
jgi:CheY-like chemotaxis protein